jgi:serine/threonine-protein kinase
MGEVYRARDTRLERQVAIKILTSVIDADARERLLREARAAAALSHPNICIVHEIAEYDGRPFIVMEHVDGRPLSALAGAALPPSTVVRYGVQIADALAHAHERGIIHRDLKGANLILTAEGRVKVLDFGIATLSGDAATAATRAATTPGIVAATAGYIAPEVLKGSPADRRSDIWSLGIVLYELASGRHPFSGNTAFEVTSAILRDEPAPLPKGAGALLTAIVARCLAKEPAHRYQQAGEVRAALEAVAMQPEQSDVSRPVVAAVPAAATGVKRAAETAAADESPRMDAWPSFPSKTCRAIRSRTFSPTA